jgi:hypothetical protein
LRNEARVKHAPALVERFASRTALVGVIRLGYVGLPLALRFSEAPGSAYALLCYACAPA